MSLSPQKADTAETRRAETQHAETHRGPARGRDAAQAEPALQKVVLLSDCEQGKHPIDYPWIYSRCHCFIPNGISQAARLWDWKCLLRDFSVCWKYSQAPVLQGVSACLVHLKSLIQSGLKNTSVLDKASEEIFTPGFL